MRTLVTIDGIDGSGKSTFARSLVQAFEAGGIRTSIVRVDDFRRTVEWDGTANEANVYYDAYFDLGLCDRCLQAFLAGSAQVEIPAYDTVSESTRGTRVLDFAGVQLVVVEGVFPRRLAAAAQAFAIYLDAPKAEARRRIIARDLHKGRTRDEIEHRIDDRYFPSQDRYHTAFSPREAADVVVDNACPETPRYLRHDLSRLPGDLREIVARLVGADR